MEVKNVYAKYKAFVIVTSDTCSKDLTQDQSGKYVVQELERLGFSSVKKLIVPDDKDTITHVIRNIVQDKEITLLITVGGTGLCPRDVTPEACRVLYQKECNGISTALLKDGLRYNPHAALSRLSAGIVNYCLVINFPGKLKACETSMALIQGFLEHALEQVKFDPKAVAQTHLMQDRDMQNLVTSSISRISNETSIQANASNSPTKSKSPLSTLNINTNSMSPEGTSQSPRPRPTLNTAGNGQSTPSTPNSPLPTNGSTTPKFHDSSSNQVGSISVSSIIMRGLSRESPYKMVEYEEALDMLGTKAHKLCQNNVEEVALDSVDAASKILGHVLAKDLCSLRCVPPYRVSTMDGFVVNVHRSIRTIVMKNPKIEKEMKVVNNYETFEELRKLPNESENFFCYYVNTGKRVPEEDFAVVPVENTSAATINQGYIKINEIKLNCYTRATGSDLNLEDCIAAGTKIGPIELSLIVAMGHKKVDIVRKPVISIMSTGDELISVHDDTANRDDPTKVLDVNEPLLAALIHEHGFPIVREGIIGDNFEKIKKKILESLKTCDVLLITGGASMGTKDFVKDCIEAIGGKIHFGRVNIKPGKPAAFASLELDSRQKFVFSLPGNPVSAYITTQLLVLPFIESGISQFRGQSVGISLQDIGYGRVLNVRVSRVLDDTSEGYQFDGRLEFLRAKFAIAASSAMPGTHQDVEISIKQQSSRLLSLKDCDCLVMVDRGQKGKRLAVDQLYKAIRLRV